MREKMAKTMQMRLGFADNDMKKPLHDQIMVWLDRHAAHVVNEVFVSKDWREQDIASLRNSVDKIIDSYKSRIPINKPEVSSPKATKRVSPKLSDLAGKWASADELMAATPLSETQRNLVENWNGIEEDLPRKSPAVIISKEWEHPVVAQSSNLTTGYRSAKQVVGYVDMKINFSYTRLAVEGVDFDLESLDGTPVRWCETKFNTAGIHNSWRRYDPLMASILVEVKTEISNLGELFRQLNTYKEFENLPMLIVCPDDSHQELIREQGFFFYKYQSQ